VGWRPDLQVPEAHLVKQQQQQWQDLVERSLVLLFQEGPVAA
jgi:hypothetical protein